MNSDMHFEKKILTFLCLFLFISEGVWCQYDFDWEVTNQEQATIVNCSNDASNNIYCLGRNHSGIFEINKYEFDDGSISNSVLVEDDNVNLLNIHFNETINSLVVFGSLLKSSESMEKQDSIFFITYFIDENLEFVSQKKSYIGSHGHIFDMDYAFSSGTFYILYNMYNPLLIPRTGFIRLSSSGDKINQNELPSNLTYKAYSIIENFNNTRNSYSLGIPSFQIDSLMNFVEGSEKFVDFFPSSNHYDACKWADDHYLVTTSGFANTQNFGFGSTMLYLLDSTLNVVDFTGIDNTSMFSSPTVNSPMGIDLDSNIYVINKNQGFSQKSSFKIAKFDKFLNKIWEHNYEDSQDFSTHPNGMQILGNEGFVIYGFRNDLVKDTINGYIIKFDDKGNVSSLNHSIYNQDLKVIPNPSSTKIKIIASDFHQLSNVRLVNMMGQNVSPQTDLRLNSSIDIEHLTPGLYKVVLQDTNGQCKSVNFVKKSN